MQDELDLKSKEKQFVEQVKVHEGWAKDLKLKEKQFREQVMKHKSRLEIQRKELKSKEGQFEERENVLESNEKDYDERLKEQIIIK